MFTLKKKLGTPLIKFRNTLQLKKKNLFYFQEKKNCNKSLKKKTTDSKPNIKPTTSARDFRGSKPMDSQKNKNKIPHPNAEQITKFEIIN